MHPTAAARSRKSPLSRFAGCRSAGLKKKVVRVDAILNVAFVTNTLPGRDMPVMDLPEESIRVQAFPLHINTLAVRRHRSYPYPTSGFGHGNDPFHEPLNRNS